MESRPFTALLIATKKSLHCRSDEEFARHANVAGTYRYYLLVKNWIPAEKKIIEIVDNLRKACVGKDVQIQPIKDFLEAAEAQKRNHPDDALYPEKRQGDSTKFANVISAVYLNQEEAQNEIIAAFRQARLVRILMIRGFAILGARRSLLRPILKEKNPSDFKMQLLMLDPCSSAALERTKEINETQNQMVEGIRHVEREIVEIRNDFKIDVEMRHYSDQPIWRIFFLDDLAFASSFQKGIDGDRTHMIKVQNVEGGFYGALERHFDTLWNKHASHSHDVSINALYRQAMALLGEHCDRRLIWHCKTVAKVAREIALGAKAKHVQVNVDMVEVAALLHDLGKGRSTKLDHAWIGAEIVRSSKELELSEDNREALAKMIERHTGVGLSSDEIRSINKKHNLNIPVRDYIPQSLEEIIVAYADKLVVTDQMRSFEEQIIEKKLQWGKDSAFVRKMQEWQELLGEPHH